LVKVIVGPKAFGQGDFTGEEVEAAKAAFFGDILKRFDQMLEGGGQFLISSTEATVVDIVFYNEISNGLMLMRVKGFKRMFPRVDTWVELMGDLPELADHGEKLADTIDEHNLE